MPDGTLAITAKISVHVLTPPTRRSIATELPYSRCFQIPIAATDALLRGLVQHVLSSRLLPKSFRNLIASRL
jgi:hypothetical protein